MSDVTTKAEGGPGRQGFSPFVDGLDAALQGGVPLGSWISFYGPPGSLKTLHSLAFCLNGLRNGEKCVYLTTEMTADQLFDQLHSLRWDSELKDVHYTRFANWIIKNADYGKYQMVVIDIDSMYWWAKKANAVVREEETESKKKVRKWYWYDDPSLLAHVLMVALGAVGVVRRNVEEISLEEIERSRLIDGLAKHEKSSTTKAPFTVNTDIAARVVIDSISPYVTGRYSMAGRIATDLKMRLSLPNVTYVIVSHESSTTERELGVELGHVVDGRIRLWNELEQVPESGTKESRVYGWIAKMRSTDHSRLMHAIILERGNMTTLRWVPPRQVQQAATPHAK